MNLIQQYRLPVLNQPNDKRFYFLSSDEEEEDDEEGNGNPDDF